MDGGFRRQRPVETRATSQPEPVQQRVEEPRATQAHDTATRLRQSSAVIETPAKRRLKWFMPGFIGVAVLLVLLTGWLLWSTSRASGAAIDTGKYQAVFFTNGQVYFGKLDTLGGDYMKLTDVYYLQSQNGDTTSTADAQQATTDQSNVQLIKRGNEVHGPEDEMVIAKDQIQFFENLKKDSKVSQLIAQYKSSN